MSLHKLQVQNQIQMWLQPTRATGVKGRFWTSEKPFPCSTKIKVLVKCCSLDIQSAQHETQGLAVEPKLCNCFWYLVQAAFKSFINKFKIITGYSLMHFAEAQIQPKCMKETKQKKSFQA